MKIRFSNFVIAVAALVLAHTAFAAEEITFPVSELGNCATKTACRTYCDMPENIKACIEFAREHNLANNEQVSRARKLADALKSKGPGGCSTVESCRTYCENTTHLEECTAFARKYALIAREESSRLEKIISLDELKIDLPGNCTNVRNCRAYCAEAIHVRECLDFAEKAKALPAKEIQRARELLPSPTPIRTRLPARRLPEVSAFPATSPRLQISSSPVLNTPMIDPDLLRGAGTNIPPVKTQVRTTSYRRAYLGSILNFFFR